MPSNFIVPNIYQDRSNQSQGYFAFCFSCQICGWAVDTTPQRSKIATATNVMDVGVGLLGGFWGRAAQAGEQIYGSNWHKEQAEALQKAWVEIQHDFNTCAHCHLTVCTRCFNSKVNLCVRCAPDLKADGASYQHELNVEAQRQQIQGGYQAPQFNTAGVPSAVDGSMLKPANDAPARPATSQDGYPTSIACSRCQHMGAPGKFCENCGTKLALPDLFCPGCATKVGPTTRFCPECGTKLQQAN